MENIGEAIRKIRILKGLSQENIANMLKLSLVAYGDIERGKSTPTKSRLEQIAKVLGMTIDDIKSFDDKIEFIFNNTGDAYGTHNHIYHLNQSELLKLNFDKAKLEIDLLNIQKEKAEIEAQYWKEKYKNEGKGNS